MGRGALGKERGQEGGAVRQRDRQRDRQREADWDARAADKLSDLSPTHPHVLAWEALMSRDDKFQRD